MTSDEPAIIINGIRLTQAQAMTIRVALGAYAIDLGNNGLGEDEVGRSICAGYQQAIQEIHKIMFGGIGRVMRDAE